MLFGVYQLLTSHLLMLFSLQPRSGLLARLRRQTAGPMAHTNSKGMGYRVSLLGEMTKYRHLVDAEAEARG
jgi:hypothetical protein